MTVRSLLAALLVAAAPASAQDAAQLSQSVAENGLAATEAALSAVADPDATQAFALGGVRFLRAIEVTLQTRWRLGINAERTELPILRLPVPPNPSPEPFAPEAIEALFARLVDDLAAARAPLDGITDSDRVELPIRLADLWFDINLNATRNAGEGLAEVAGLVLTGRPAELDDAVVHFDTADAAWLSAYTHFLSAFAELVLAFEPRDQIARVIEASRAMDALATDTFYPNALDMQFGQQIDRLAMIYFSIRQQPVPAHTRAARAHLLSMIARNRDFWFRVAVETDDRGEWIPNDSQTQALGIPVPQGTAAGWQAVLDDAEALLNGTRLMPHWRLREGAGINLRRLMDDPVPVDLAEWAHGIGLLPFAEQGERISSENWFAFQRLVSGNAFLFAVYLN